METIIGGVGGGGDHAAFKLLLSCPSGLCPSEVLAMFDQAYDRIPHPDASLECSISEIWDGRVQQNPGLYNGLKFRYSGHSLTDGVDSTQKTSIRLHLGLTDYRTFVGTNLNPLWEDFLILSEGKSTYLQTSSTGELVFATRPQRFDTSSAVSCWFIPRSPVPVRRKQDYLNLRCSRPDLFYLSLVDDWTSCQHTSNPLGNGAIIETSDNQIVVLQRSTNVGEFPGYFVFPGGHPEPQEVGITNHQADRELGHQMVNKKVSQEMFDSIIREAVEEIGVPASKLSEPIFIGISQRVLNVRPTAFFFIKCSLHSDEIQQHYSSAQDGFESTQLYTMPMSHVATITHKMPGCHQGGFALYKLMVEFLPKKVNGRIPTKKS